VLGIGGTLLLTGAAPAWRRADTAAPWPAILSLGFLFSTLTFFTQYSHHFGRPGPRPATGRRRDSSPVAPDPLFATRRSESLRCARVRRHAILLQATFIAAIVLLALRRWGPRLPTGSFTVILGMNALMLARRETDAARPGAIVAVSPPTCSCARCRLADAAGGAAHRGVCDPAIYFAL